MSLSKDQRIKTNGFMILTINTFDFHNKNTSILRLEPKLLHMARKSTKISTLKSLGNQRLKSKA
jgi:hypothetical protein